MAETRFKRGWVSSKPGQSGDGYGYGGGHFACIDGVAVFTGESFSALELARFLAAAPALYDALSQCVQLRYPFTGKYDEKQSLDHWLSEDKEGNGEAKFWIAAHAALALAEGKQ